ncbi:MAG: hypothetical protein KGJ86_07035 [Chloroflexota bacterium]|nr:hypothetical protein [Chloroflexota bacterium]
MAVARPEVLMNPGDPSSAFHIIQMVGRVYSALTAYADVISSDDIKGPWEVTVGVLCHEGGLLVGFGQGWPHPMDGGPQLRARQTNCLWHMELADWPSGDNLEELTYRLGSWIENAWDSHERRFLAKSGDLQGHLDLRQFTGT